MLSKRAIDWSPNPPSKCLNLKRTPKARGPPLSKYSPRLISWRKPTNLPIRGANSYKSKIPMFKTKMEENRLKNLQKSKSKFLSRIAANQMDNDPNVTLEEKMEKLIKQAELLASFLLNKYSQTGTQPQISKKRTSASKRSRQKKKNSRKKNKAKGRLHII